MAKLWKVLDWTFFAAVIIALVVACCGCSISRADPFPDRPILDVDALTDQQCWELLGYMDQMQEWQTRGEIPPEPEPPEWLKKYLGPNPEKNAAQLADLAAAVPVVKSLPETESAPAEPPPAPAASKPAKNSRPWVNVYSNEQGCPGCNAFKAWLASQDQASLPVEFRIRTGSQIPSWVTAVPTFHWNAPNGKSYLHEGWNGPEELLQKLNHKPQKPEGARNEHRLRTNQGRAASCRFCR